MTRRGATTTQERILACLPFLVPLLNAYPFGTFLFVQVPPFRLAVLSDRIAFATL